MAQGAQSSNPQDDTRMMIARANGMGGTKSSFPFFYQSRPLATPATAYVKHNRYSIEFVRTAAGPKKSEAQLRKFVFNISPVFFNTRDRLCQK